MIDEAKLSCVSRQGRENGIFCRKSFGRKKPKAAACAGAPQFPVRL
jgi:hypothetical protein